MFDQQFEDQDLQCVECGGTFVFSAEDQEFFQQKRYSTPKRCPDCRARRKAQQGGGGGRGGRGGGGGYNKPQYNVICSACGCETTVPFEPRDDRPVFCSDCYRNNR